MSILIFSPFANLGNQSLVNKKSFGGILTVVFYVEKKSCVRKECYDEVFLT